ncbi:hypothetical protein [Pararobbsia alpina]|nr:hypothetical protein [Pararobbsia alpina]
MLILIAGPLTILRTPTENVISNPGDSIYEGAHVQVQKGGTSS